MSSPRNRVKTDEKPGFWNYFNKIISNWYWIIISVFLAFVTAFIFNYLTIPHYRIHSRISIAEESPTDQIRSELPGNFVFEDYNSIQKIIGTLKSYVLADKTLKELDFGIAFYQIKKKGLIHAKVYHKEPIHVLPDSGASNRTNIAIHVDIKSKDEFVLSMPDLNIKKEMKFGEPFRQEGFAFTVKLKNSALDDLEDFIIESYYFEFKDHNALVNHYIENLKVDRSAYSKSILELSIIGENALQEVTYLNKFCEVYQKHRIDDKNERALKTLNYVNDQISFIGSQLSDAEDSLQLFRVKQFAKQVDPPVETILEKINNLQEQKSALRLQLRYLQYIRQIVTIEGNNSFILPDLLGLEMKGLNPLVAQMNELITKKEKYKAILKNSNASSLVLDKELEALEKSIFKTIEANKQATNFTMKLLNERIAMLKGDLQITPLTEKELLRAQKNFDFNNSIFNNLIEKQLEANLAMASTVADTKVLEAAKVQNAELITRNKEENYLIALLLGLLIPIGLIFIVDMFTNRLTEESQVISKVESPVIGKLGHGKQNGQLTVVKNDHGLLAESFRTMRAKLQYLMPNTDKKVISFTSGSSGEGKTFCSSNFSAILASTKKKTVLVGLDLRKPKLHEIFQMDNAAGVSTFLIGRHKLDEVIRPSGVENLDVITSGPIPPNPVELLERKQLTELIQNLKNKYDFIIIDSPPIGLVADSFIINEFVDLNLFVIRMNFTKKYVLNLLDELKDEKALKNLNIVINDIKQSNSPYGRRYNYYYGSYRARKNKNTLTLSKSNLTNVQNN